MGKRDEDPIGPYKYIQIVAIVVSAFFILILANIYNSYIGGLHLRATSNVAIASLVGDSKTQSTIVQKTRAFNFFNITPMAQIKLNAPSFSFFKPVNTTISTVKPVVKTPVSVIPAPFTPIITPKPIANPLASLPAPEKIENIINAIPTFDIAKADPRKSVVQILCRITEGNIIKNISSSGIIISDTGLILTNAHVAIHPFLDQYTDQSIACTARSGSPAVTTHTLSLIYISPEWTARHPGEIHGSLGQDSGEADFAILKTSPLTLQSPLQRMPLRTPDSVLAFGSGAGSRDNINNISSNQSIRIIGYPILGNTTALLQREEPLTIDSVYGFSGNDTELIETSVSSVGKSGASGGALVDNQKYLIGMVANIVNESQSSAISPTSNTKVHGISLDHINKKLQSQTGMSLYSILDTDGSSLRKYFESNYLSKVKQNLN